MKHFSEAVRFGTSLWRQRFTPCLQCRQAFATSLKLESGHNKWSKIRHEKGAADAKKGLRRVQFAQALTMYSRLYGPDPNDNPQLAASVHSAKKAGVPKHVIEAAIARGQGRSLDGASLESVTIEAILSPSVAFIVEVETDNKIRAMVDIKQILGKYNATTSSTKFFFTRRGRVVFEKSEAGFGVDDILDVAIEAGAEDIDTDEEGNIVVWTAPSATSRTCKAVEAAFGLKILSSDILWSPNEESMVNIKSVDDLQRVSDLVAALRDCQDIQAIYCNASRGSIAEEDWARLESNIDA